MIQNYGADAVDSLFYQIVHLKRISNGQIKECKQLINTFKNSGIYITKLKKNFFQKKTSKKI